MDTTPTTAFMERKCPVCEDFVSGWHYGVMTCESCKVFFKRRVQANVQLNCDKHCVVTFVTRRRCMACRFAKCIEKGMDANLVRQNHARGGSQPGGQLMQQAAPSNS